MADHISTLKLHQLRYGELSAAEEQILRTHVVGCARCTARLQAQEGERAAFVVTPVPEAIRALAAAEAEAERGGVLGRLRAWLRQPLWAGGGLAMAAAAAMAMVVVVSSPGIRTKGDSEGIEVLVENFGVLDEDVDSIRPGDRLQLRIPPGDWEQVWVGDEGAWLGSFPVSPSKSWQLMPFSLEVDEQPGPEEIVVVLANHPLTAQEADAALAGRPLGGVEVHLLQLRKER